MPIKMKKKEAEQFAKKTIQHSKKYGLPLKNKKNNK